MDGDFASETCFTCCKKPIEFLKLSDSDNDPKLSIRHIICQHFWFKEDDLRSAIICAICWEKVDQFHQFFLDVKELHEHLEVAPLSMFIKQEEITIEETQLQENCTHVSEENQKLFDIADCKLEIPEECDELPKKEEPAEMPQQIKENKYARRLPIKRVVKRKYPHLRKPTVEEWQEVGHAEGNHAAEKRLPFKCNRCPKNFIKERLLKRHVAEHESLENETAKCEFCDKCFRNNYRLNRHVKSVHKKPTDFICEICLKGFYERAMFVEHRKTHELSAEQLKEQCPVCNKWLKNHANWLEHMRRHKAGEFKCEICDHVSINMMSLQLHMKSRHAADRKRYVCELCGWEYARAVVLKEHIAKVHTKEHPYQCQYCEKKFFTSANMYSHRQEDHPQEWLEDRMSKYARIEEVSDGGEAVF